MPGGRPSDYSQEKIDEICSELAEGKSMREVCRRVDMPSLGTVMRWLGEHEEFQDQYARAKEIGMAAIAEEILDIADNSANDYMERQGQDGESIGSGFSSENVQRSRLRIDSRKWLLSKLVPKKYGDRMENIHSGPGGGPIQTQDLSGKSDEELQAIINGSKP